MVQQERNFFENPEASWSPGDGITSLEVVRTVVVSQACSNLSKSL